MRRQVAACVDPSVLFWPQWSGADHTPHGSSLSVMGKVFTCIRSFSAHSVKNSPLSEISEELGNLNPQVEKAAMVAGVDWEEQENARQQQQGATALSRIGRVSFTTNEIQRQGSRSSAEGEACKTHGLKNGEWSTKP